MQLLTTHWPKPSQPHLCATIPWPPLPQFYCSEWYHMVWDILLSSLSQLSWLHPLPAYCALPVHGLAGQYEKLESPWLRASMSVLSTLFSFWIQNAALYQLLERKLTLFQSKLENSPNRPKGYSTLHNVILQKYKENSGAGDRGKEEEGGDESFLQGNTCSDLLGISLLGGGEAKVLLCNISLPAFLHLLHYLSLHSQVLSLLFLLALTPPDSDGRVRSGWVMVPELRPTHHRREQRMQIYF